MANNKVVLLEEFDELLRRERMDQSWLDDGDHQHSDMSSYSYWSMSSSAAGNILERGVRRRGGEEGNIFSYVGLNFTWVPDTPASGATRAEDSLDLGVYNRSQQLWEGVNRGRSMLLDLTRAPKGRCKFPILNERRLRERVAVVKQVRPRMTRIVEDRRSQIRLIYRREGWFDIFSPLKTSFHSHLTRFSRIFLFGKLHSLITLLGLSLLLTIQYYQGTSASRGESGDCPFTASRKNDLDDINNANPTTNTELLTAHPFCSTDPLQIDNFTDEYLRQAQVFEEKVHFLEKELSSLRQQCNERLAVKEEKIWKLVQGIRQFRQSRFCISKTTMFQLLLFLGVPVLLRMSYLIPPF